MHIKDIVNRELVNLENCESEPIHIPGSIQPHGFLLGVNADTQLVEYCSGNLVEFISLPYEKALGKSFKDIFGKEQAEEYQGYIKNLDSSFNSPLILHLANKRFNAAIHSSGSTYLIELEPADLKVPDVAAQYKQTKQFVTYMEQASSLRDLCQAVADETRAITGYDRVMVYRFDKNYNGEVYAESKVDTVEPFFGLHYPHTDIPAQARELYLKNQIRLIVDIDYTPVPIYTLGQGDNTALDLSYSTLRSVSPIHVQYLHNMGVGATLNISLIHQGKLWGLIACHHYSPHIIDSHQRIAARLQGHFMTSQIGVREIAEEYEITKQVTASLDRMLAMDFALEREVFHAIAAQQDLLELCGARGVAIIIDGVLYTGGNTPASNDILDISRFASEASTNGYLSTSNLTALYEPASELCDSAAGIIYQALDKAQVNSIIWFRPETVHEVNWAGDPSKSIEKDRNQLSPRKSFETWKQTVKCQSMQWCKPELNAAANYAYALQKHINTLFLQEDETKHRLLNARLSEAYAELENLNWISTHDLKEPLRKIQVFASKIVDSDGLNIPDNVMKPLQKIQASASRMQTLIQDVLSYSKVRNAKDSFASVSLNTVRDEVLAEMDEEIMDKNAIVESDELPEVEGVDFLLAQLLSNLLRNSLKFVKEGVTTHIDISYDGMKEYTPIEDLPLKLYHKIDIRDNGIGFENKYNQSIFKVFSRLHGHAAYGGTGVGLALCKKIMENHHGAITAHGVPGEGATFTLYFPV